jgi:hypothetical protein
MDSKLPEQLIPFAEVRERTGLRPNVLSTRLQRLGVISYVDPKDTRRRLLDVRDIEKLVALRTAPRRKPSRPTAA